MNTLVDEIRRFHDGRKSGILALADGDKHVDVFYREGTIEAVSSNLGAHRLGEYFVREGYAQPEDIGVLLSESQRRKISLGEAAVHRKFVDVVELADIVRRQATDVLRHVLGNGFSINTFTAGLRSFFVPAKINFAQILLEVSRNNPEPLEVAAALPFVLSNGRDLSHLPWYPQELCVLGELKHPNTTSSLAVSTGMDEANLKRILGVFNRLGLLKVLETAEPENDSNRTGVAEELPSTASEQSTALVKRADFPFEHLTPVVSNAVANEKLEVLKNSASFISEQFRNLKVRIAEFPSETPVQVITVSSPDVEDGKSLISANLALSFSMDTGRRVIIVDCDLRRPSLDKYLGVSLAPGLFQYLEDGRLRPYCYVRRLENLFFLTAGGPTENPVELLSLERMKELIEYLKTQFDTIILDSPPFSPFADARIVTALSDGLIMVIRRGRTSYGSIEKTFKVLDRHKLLGVVFNDVKPMLFNTYYNRGYYHYGQGNSYAYPNNRKIRSSPKNYLDS